MKKTRQELEGVEFLVQRAYNRRGRKLRERLNEPYSKENSKLGYSWKSNSEEIGTVTYNVFVSKLPEDKKETEYRIKLHEYGHIYLAHFEGVYEDLDRSICNVFKNRRGEIVDIVNKNCGIDFGDKLVERIIEDPVLNHSIHNIAMDMEVNSKILSNEDIDEMERDIEEINNRIYGSNEKVGKESKVKLILPCRYYTPDGSPFPDGLSYPQYLLMIVENLDQFVKMLVSISQGGNGDTSNVTAEDIKEATQGNSNGLDDLLEQNGMADKEEGEAKAVDGDGSKLPDHDSSNSGGLVENAKEKIGRTGCRSYHYDHGTDSRDEADQKRLLGEITAGGGIGCGSGGSAIGVRVVGETDVVDSAIDEAVQDQKNRVIQFKTKRNVMRNWNLGRNRTVICPSISQKVKIDTNPKIVYLIDISGSMDTELIDRILNTVAKKMRKINKGLRYDIITWSTYLGEHIKDIDPKKGIKRISTGGGTSLAEGIKYFKENYDESSILIIASDFEDYLEEWVNVLNTMKGYSVWGFNYGSFNYKVKWPKNFKLRNFNKSYKSKRW